MIPYGRQDVDEADIEAVVDVLRSDYLTQGPIVPAFEQTVAAYCGAQHAVAVNSATSALHLACLALGVGNGDRVWTSPITFVASANCARYCGATVDFVDIDPRTYNLDVDRLAEKLAEAERTGRLPKIVIPVHMCGQPCDMSAIRALADRYGFRIVEDASHALGARFGDAPVGNCRYSDITVFSFHPVKMITTAEGGMALTNDARLARRMQLLRTHGITSASAEMLPRAPDELWNYQQIELGFNYRLSEVHAALGTSQMRRLDDFVARRRALAERYDRILTGLPLTLPLQRPDRRSSWHLYVVRLQSNGAASGQRQTYEALHAAGVLANVHYIPVYRQPYYESQGFKAGYCPEAERYHREALSLPLHVRLTESDQDRVVAALESALQ